MVEREGEGGIEILVGIVDDEDGVWIGGEDKSVGRGMKESGSCVISV